MAQSLATNFFPGVTMAEIGNPYASAIQALEREEAALDRRLAKLRRVIQDLRELSEPPDSMNGARGREESTQGVAVLGAGAVSGSTAAMIQNAWARPAGTKASSESQLRQQLLIPADGEPDAEQDDGEADDEGDGESLRRRGDATYVVLEAIRQSPGLQSAHIADRVAERLEQGNPRKARKLVHSTIGYLVNKKKLLHRDELGRLYVIEG